MSAFMTGTGSARLGTYVYVSSAEDGDIGTYALAEDGSLKPGARVAAAKLVMPMCVSLDKPYLYAASRSKPYTVFVYAIDHQTGALTQCSKAPLAESFPYISIDKTGQYLFGAGYGGNVIGVSAIGTDGGVSNPRQVVPTARNPHSIVTDRRNRYVFVPHLGSDQVFQFLFDAKTGKLTANTPPVLQMKAKTGPRHIIISVENRFAYLLHELTATVTTLALDSETGLLSPVSEAVALPPGCKLVPGAPRLPAGCGEDERNRSNDIWASDLHLTPNEKFLYATERTSSTITTFGVEGATGKLTYLASTPTEKQPRGFAIDPKGKHMVVTGELSDRISVYAIDGSGALTLLQRYPTGKGSNWVEIVSFD